MRIYISCDMEGVAGVVSNQQRDDSAGDYGVGRSLMVRELNAAITGALAGGATELLVNDSHDTMVNLQPDDVHPAAQLLRGGTKLLSMIEGVDRGFDGAFFVGYHASRHTLGGTLGHTYSEGTNLVCRLNGREVGETELNGLAAGYFGVPLLLATGDQHLCRQAREFAPGMTTVQVKEGICRVAAISPHPTQVAERIRAGAERAVRNAKKVKPVKWRSPYTLDLEFFYESQAYLCQRIPGVERTAGNVTRFRHADYLTVFKAFLAMLCVGGAASR